MLHFALEAMLNNCGPIPETTCLRWFIEMGEALLSIEKILELSDIGIELQNVCLSDNDEIRLVDLRFSSNSFERAMERRVRDFR